MDQTRELYKISYNYWEFGPFDVQSIQKHVSMPVIVFYILFGSQPIFTHNLVVIVSVMSVGVSVQLDVELDVLVIRRMMICPLKYM